MKPPVTLAGTPFTSDQARQTGTFASLFADLTVDEVVPRDDLFHRLLGKLFRRFKALSRADLGTNFGEAPPYHIDIEKQRCLVISSGPCQPLRMSAHPRS